jgi:PIN domain nuclease of toxin-antitoxin system
MPSPTSGLAANAYRPGSFDRALIAQSQLKDLPVLTADPEIGRYEVEAIW